MLCISPVQLSVLFGKYIIDLRRLKSFPAWNFQFQVSGICRIFRKRGSPDSIKVIPVCPVNFPVPIE